MRLRLVLWLGVLVLGAALVFGWRPFRSAHYVNLPPTATGPWVAFGDSLTEGTGATEGVDYPMVLGKTLGVPITNLGRSGDTSAGGLARIDEVIALHPRVVLLCLGGNDSLQHTPWTQTSANLGAIIDRLVADGSFVVLIGVRSASLRDRNADRFAELASAKRVFHISDILDGIAFKPIYMSDPIHPNDEGYRRIGERMAKELRPLLSRLQASAAAPTPTAR